MSGAARGRAKPRTLEDRIRELQARVDVQKKKQQLQETIKKAKGDLQSLRRTRK